MNIMIIILMNGNITDLCTVASSSSHCAAAILTKRSYMMHCVRNRESVLYFKHVQCSAVQRSTVKYRTVQYSAV